MRIMRRNLDAEWNLQRERDWERARALRSLRNALFFLLVSSVVFAAAFATAWTKERFWVNPEGRTRLEQRPRGPSLNRPVREGFGKNVSDINTQENAYGKR